MAAQHYDAVVIGAGQGGDPLSRALANAGRKTAIVERAYVGGTCVNTGCTPTKTMIASAQVAYSARRAGDYGVQVTVGGVDMAAVRKRKQAVVESFRSGTESHIEKTENLTLIRGEASFTGPETLQVKLHDGSQDALAASQFFINTGTRPATPPIPGLNHVPYLDNASIENLEEVPEHLLILGGSYIALEFGQMFRRFGSRVTIVEQAPHLLAREDQDVSDEIAKILREDGIEILVGTKAKQAAKADTGVELTVQTPDGVKTLSGSHLLVATGRTPNTDVLGLQTVGVALDEHGFIQVNERLGTNVPNIWAMGDVKGGPQFTHISYDDFRIIESNLLKGGRRTTADRPIPYVVFTDPQLGRVGLTEKEARDKGLKIQVAKLPMSEVARAIETDETRGFMKAVVDAQTKQILGCALLGFNGGETMAVLEMAMLGKVPYTAIRDGVFAHPTLAESLNNLFMTLDE